MAGFFQWKDAQALLKKIDYPSTIKYYVAEKKLSLMKVSSMIGKPDNFLSRRLFEDGIDLELLLCMSMHLDVNLFEPMLHSLPDDVRKTRAEQQLEAEKAALMARIAELEKENQLLKDLIKKG